MTNEKEIDGKLVKAILKKKFEYTKLSIFFCFAGIISICLLFLQFNTHKMQMWYLMFGVIAICLIIYNDIEIIMDYIKLDFVCEKAKGLNLSLFSKNNSYYISYIDKSGCNKNVSVRIPNGLKKHKWLEIPENSKVQLYYTRRSKIFIGIYCNEISEETKEKYKDIFINFFD